MTKNSHCIRCGVPFIDNAESSQAASGQNSAQLWNREDVANHAPPVNGGIQKEPFMVMHDETADPADVPRYNHKKLSGMKSGDTVRVVVPPRKKEMPKKRRVRWGRFVTIMVVLLSLIGLFAWGGSWGFNKVSGWIDSLIKNRQIAAQLKQPTVEPLIVDGEPWHKITFYGKDGDRILVDSPRRILPVKDGTAELLLADLKYLPSNLDDVNADIPVQIVASLFAKDGTETSLAVPSYLINVPVSMLTVLTPDSLTFTTNEIRTQVQLQVMPGSRVIVGGNNLSDLVDSDGYVTSSVSVKPGENIIRITAEAPQHRNNVVNLVIIRPISEIPIDFDNDVPVNTRDGVVTITGTTVPGATLTTDANMEGDITVSLDGEFSMKVTLKLYGWNTIRIQAEKDGKNAQVDYRINHIPDLQTYTQKAWVFEYGMVGENPEAWLGKIYVVNGSPIKKLDAQGRKLYLFQVGTAKAELIVMENFSNTEFEIGKEYKVFADVQGSHDDYAWLAARFVYNP